MTVPTTTEMPAERTRIPDLGPRGEGWVVLQVLLFLIVIASGLDGPAWSGPTREVAALVGVGLMALGLALVAAGIVALRRQLTAYPMPVPGGRLIEEGVFGLVRHPMYGGGVIAALGWGLVTASIATIASALVLFMFFDLKSRREEAWLRERFAGYAAYRLRTHRLIPWVC